MGTECTLCHWSFFKPPHSNSAATKESIKPSERLCKCWLSYWKCASVWKDIGIEVGRYLSVVVVIHNNNDSLTPVGNIASCLLTLAKEIEKTPLSVLFTSVDWEGYLQGQGDMNDAYRLHLFPLDAAALITSISIWEIVCKDLYLQWWSIRSEGMLTHWETQTNCLLPQHFAVVVTQSILKMSSVLSQNGEMMIMCWQMIK